MSTQMIDLRSDTVTRPTEPMREAIARAVVDDDVLGNDPTVQELQEFAAELLGMEAAVFMPSGTMTNQIALRVHCLPGDEFFCDAGCHVYNYEQGAFAQLSGLVARTISGERGILRLEQLEGLIRPENDHFVRTRLVCLENTHNRGGGAIYPLDEIAAISEWARRQGLAMHLDGARLFNAVVATGIPAAEWARHFDTVSICLSKGLGAPVGSVLAGDEAAMRKAKRYRKLFGGGMRQAGIIAAGGLYALQHHIDRLSIDHDNARRLAERISKIDGLSLTFPVETNILFIDVESRIASAPDIAKALADRGVLVLPESGTRIRALTHLDVDRQQIDQAADQFAAVMEELRRETAIDERLPR